MLSSGIKERINSTYAQYNDNTVEIEARFGYLIQRGFKPGVSRQVFNRIREYFDARGQVVERHTTDYIAKNARKTVTIPVGDESPQTIWIQKIRLWNQEDPNYGVRYSASREIPVEPISNYKPDVIREKHRYSYSVFKDMVRIDLTIVNMVEGIKGKSKENGTSYEVEIELVNSLGLNYFEKALIVTLHRVLDTVMLYNSREAKNIVQYTNMLLDSDKRNVIDFYPLVQARNLKLKDMIWGGLVGNKETGYSVTHKADGNRKMLVFHSSGIWLVMGPYSLNRLTQTEIPTLTGTILDGEMIPIKNRLNGAPDSRIWYLAFDCMSWNGDNSIQNRPHAVRMNHAQEVANLFKNKLLYVNTKTFKSFNTPQQFFAVMNETLSEQEQLSYKQDGLMFTPSNSIYNSRSDKLPLYKRVLTTYPDITKWKPPSQLTIDFKIRWKVTPAGKRQIQIYVNDKGKPVLFKGNKIFPYNDAIDSDNSLTLGLPNNTVVEYGWDYDKNLFVPHRVRNDKIKPNKIDIAEDIWMDIQRPLEEDTLRGENFVLMRSYHNRIKKKLFSDGSYNKINPTLLDIGSGRGGDIAKWKKYSKIVAVEPNPEHIVELRRRLKAYGMEDRVMIVNAGGEDTVVINRAVQQFIGDRVDVISMMLSMSFFWKSPDMINKLVETVVTNIKRNGEFIFLTIDGDLVEQSFEPAMETGPALTRLDLGPATLRYFPDKTPKELHINIEGTIVQDQVEWLVRLGDLMVKLKPYGFHFLYRHKADEEDFLNEKEITLTQMYTYGVITTEDPTITLPSPNVFLTKGDNNNDKIRKKEKKEDKKLTDGIQKTIPPLHTLESLPPIEGMNVSTLEPISGSKLEIPFKKGPSSGLPPLGLPSSGLSPPNLPSPSLPSPGLPSSELPSSGLPPLGLPSSGLPPGLPTQSISLTTITPVARDEDILPPNIPIIREMEEKFPVGQHPVNIQPPTLGMLEEKEIELSSIPMDTFQYIKVSWYTDESVVRIGAIGDGSCFFHASLNGYYQPYQNNSDRRYRMNLVRMLRRDIAATLEMKDPSEPDKTRWETAAGGQFKALYEQQKMGVNFKDVFDYPVDFSLEGLQRLFNSLEYLGNEVYQYASDLLGIDIYIMRLTNKDLYVHQNTSVPEKERKIIVISGNGAHYETIGIERQGLFQTIFDNDDPFVESIKNKTR